MKTPTKQPASRPSPPSTVSRDEAARLEVFGLILEGHAQTDIKAHCRERYPDMEMESLLIDAIQEFESIGKQSKHYLFGFCLEAARDLFVKMKNTADYPTALSAIKFIAEIAGKKDRQTKREESLKKALDHLKKAYEAEKQKKAA